MNESLLRKGSVVLIVVTCQIIGFLLGLQIFLELPADWLLSETKIPNLRLFIPFLSMFIGFAVGSIIVNLMGVELTGEEQEKARRERESGLQASGLGFLLIGALALLASSVMPEYGRTETQIVGILLLMCGSLVATNIIYLLFSIVSIVLVCIGYPQIPAIILAIPIFLSARL